MTSSRGDDIAEAAVERGGIIDARGRPRLVERGFVTRSEIVARCVDALDASVVLIQAPAGYGKTTVLSQWEHADPRPFLWISLDPRDDDPGFLVKSVATALDEVEPIDDSVFAAVLGPGPRLSSVVVPRLCDALRVRERPFVLVLDDLHWVGNRDSLDAIAGIGESVPLGSTLAIASRKQPPIPLGRLRSRRLLLELTADDLAMTLSEAAELLRGAGVNLDPEGVERLVKHTEGWPVGLYLAGLSLQGKNGGGPASGNESGEDRLVADYMRDEFLQERPAEEVDFLIRTSIFDRLSGPLCDAVLERQGSGTVLKRLSESNLLIVPLDGRDREYRYHALLREMLQAELERRGVEPVVSLHTRASRWHEEHGDLDRAVGHAIAAGDIDAVGRLVWAATPAYASGGRHATLRRWLERFSEDEIQASPLLSMSLAASETTLGKGAQAERWVATALEHDKSSRSGDADQLEAVGLILLAAGSAKDGVVRMGEEIEAAYAVLPEDDPWRSMCCMLGGISHHLAGDPARARELLEEGSRRAEGVAPNIQLISQAQLALLALDEDDPDEADALIGHAIKDADHFGLDEQPTLALVFASAALIDAQRGRAEDAARRVRLADEHLTRLDLGPWYAAEAHILLARTHLRLDEVRAAREQLAQAGRDLRGASDAAVLREWLQRAWRDADAATAVSGRWPLSPAELRLLHMLPTHLSYPEIAEHFFVSLNTVKSQARSIYQKLGVASRGEAVECARAAGLLTGDDPGASGPDGT